MYGQISAIRLHAVVLRNFKAVDKELFEGIVTRLETVRESWGSGVRRTH